MEIKFRIPLVSFQRLGKQRPTLRVLRNLWVVLGSLSDGEQVRSGSQSRVKTTRNKIPYIVDSDGWN